jgi:hypothetical protein
VLARHPCVLARHAKTLARHLYVPCDRDARLRDISRRPLRLQVAREGKREGTTPTGPVTSRGRGEPLPAPPNGTVSGRRPSKSRDGCKIISLGINVNRFPEALTPSPTGCCAIGRGQGRLCWARQGVQHVRLKNRVRPRGIAW